MIRILFSLLMLVNAPKDITIHPEVLNFDSIKASSSFGITLEKSSKCRIELIVDEEIEPYVVVEVKEGTLHLSLDQKKLPNKLRRHTHRTLKAIVSMPKVRDIELSGACGLESSAEWKADEFEASCTGASNIKSFNIQAREMDIDLSGASAFSGNIDFGELSIDLSGASDCVINGDGRKFSGELSGASRCTLNGSCDSMDVEASGASAVVAKNFETKHIEAQVSGASSASLNVTEYINAQASGASSIVYKADGKVQARVHKSGGSSIVRK